MKKIFFMLIILYSLEALEFQSEIESKYQTDFEKSQIPIFFSLNAVYRENDTYSEFKIKGSKEDLKLEKAYSEIYTGNYTLTFGRQPVSWGNSYIFNRMNSLTGINILNPKEKNNTLDGLKIKYTGLNNEKTEFVVFDVNKANNYALRQSVLVKNYELQINYIKKEKSNLSAPLDEDINDLIFEFKGDLLLGIWGQIAHSFQYDKNYYVLGLDYNFPFFQKNLYLLWEGTYSEKNKLFLNYFRYNIPFNQWTSLSGGLLISEGEQVLTTSINHKINDIVELNLSQIYADSESYKKLMGLNTRNSLELQLKAVF